MLQLDFYELASICAVTAVFSVVFWEIRRSYKARQADRNHVWIKAKTPLEAHALVKATNEWTVWDGESALIEADYERNEPPFFRVRVPKSLLEFAGDDAAREAFRQKAFDNYLKKTESGNV